MCTIDSVLLERGLVGGEGDLRAEGRGVEFQGLDFFLCSVGEGLGPEGAAAGEGAPFARDVVGFDICFDGAVVADFEGRDIGCGVK